MTGSYPEGALVAGDNDYWDDFHPQQPEDEQFSAANPLMFDAHAGLQNPMMVGSVGGGGTKGGYYAKVPTGEVGDNLNLTLLENDQLHHY